MNTILNRLLEIYQNKVIYKNNFNYNDPYEELIHYMSQDGQVKYDVHLIRP